MLPNGVVCGDIGGKRDWKTDVVRFSRCLGTLEPGCAEAGVTKLFMTSLMDEYQLQCSSCHACVLSKLTRGATRCSFPPPALGCFMDLAMSLHNEYFSTLKCSVGPLGVIASRKLVFPESDLEKSKRCETPSGPAIVV